ncbi:MAG TPA: hypothetical protein VGM54_10070 [Chthoniobacter sp.]|jgi:hypothetical protein
MNLKLCDELSLPLDIVTTRIAIYGTSGSGKTAFGRLLAEAVHRAGHRFCAIDLKNDWWGLKSSADGKTAGIPAVVFGGPKKDVALFPDAGAVVADTVCAIEQSCIVDLDELSKGKQLVFLTKFMERLYDVNREPLLLIADEADRYAPQKAMSVEANISLGAAEDICRRGRKRGIGSMWITQRTAVLNKNVADICDLTVVFRTPGARDLHELEDRVARIADKESTAEVMRLAPGLADGEAIFLSSHPKLRDHLPANARPVQLPLPGTYDSSATPGVGTRRVEPKVLAKTDLAAIEKQMASQIERAKDEDPAQLRKRVGELQRENAKLETEIAKKLQIKAVEKTRVEIKPVEKPVLKDGQLQRAEKLADLLGSMCRDLTAAIGKVGVANSQRSFANSQQSHANMQKDLHKSGDGDPWCQWCNSWHPKPRDAAHKKALMCFAPDKKPTSAQPDRTHGPGRGASLGGGERRVLIAIAQHEHGVTAEQLTVLTGYKRSSRNTYLQRLISTGRAERAGDRIVATPAGVEELGDDYEPLPTGEELRRYWLARLSGGERAILQYVLDVHPEAADREAMGAQLEYQRSSRNTYIQRLQARELVWSDREGLHASSQFFSK